MDSTDDTPGLLNIPPGHFKVPQEHHMAQLFVYFMNFLVDLMFPNFSLNLHIVNHCSSSYLNLWDSLFNATGFGFFRNDLRPPEMQPTDLTLPVTFSK